MGICVGITSGKGGVGKSSISIGLGSVLARKGYRVCLVDMDLGLKNLDIMMGLENRVFYDMIDVGQGKCSLNQALVKSKNEENLWLIPVSKSVTLNRLNEEIILNILDELKTKFDYILLDTAAGIESGFTYATHLADRFIVVTTLDQTSLQDADRIIGLLMKENAQKIQCIVNRMNPQYISKGISLKLMNALEWLSVECIGVVYEDEQIMKGYNHGHPSVSNEHSKASECFESIVRAFEGEEVILPKYHKSLLKRLFSS